MYSPTVSMARFIFGLGLTVAAMTGRRRQQSLVDATNSNITKIASNAATSYTEAVPWADFSHRSIHFKTGPRPITTASIHFASGPRPITTASIHFKTGPRRAPSPSTCRRPTVRAHGQHWQRAGTWVWRCRQRAGT